MKKKYLWLDEYGATWRQTIGSHGSRLEGQKLGRIERNNKIK